MPLRSLPIHAKGILALLDALAYLDEQARKGHVVAVSLFYGEDADMRLSVIYTPGVKPDLPASLRPEHDDFDEGEVTKP